MSSLTPSYPTTTIYTTCNLWTKVMPGRKELRNKGAIHILRLGGRGRSLKFVTLWYFDYRNVMAIVLQGEGVYRRYIIYGQPQKFLVLIFQ